MGCIKPGLGSSSCLEVRGLEEMATGEEGVLFLHSHSKTTNSLSRGKESESLRRGTMRELGPKQQGQALQSSPSHPVLVAGISFLSLPFQ